MFVVIIPKIASTDTKYYQAPNTSRVKPYLDISKQLNYELHSHFIIGAMAGYDIYHNRSKSKITTALLHLLETALERTNIFIGLPF